jgi:hypothetical protein
MRRKKARSHETSWKKEKKRRRFSKTRDIIIRLVTTLIFITLLWSSFKVWQSFRRSLWDGQHQINFVVQANDIAVFSYHVQDQVLNILTIPNKTHLVVAGGFGAYQISNIYKLGEIEKIGGGKLLSRSLQEFLAVPIDGYLIQTTDSSLQVSSGNLSKSGLASICFCVLSGSCKTNLTGWDLVRLLLAFNQLKTGQIKISNFQEEGVSKEKVLPDGSTIMSPDEVTIDNLSVELFSDKAALDEEITVSVLNGTFKGGLANNAGRLVKNLGAELINTTDADTEYKQSVLYYRNEKIRNSYTFKRLAQIFKVKKIQLNDQLEGDISLILGAELIPLL